MYIFLTHLVNTTDRGKQSELSESNIHCNMNAKFSFDLLIQAPVNCAISAIKCKTQCYCILGQLSSGFQLWTNVKPL